MGTYRYSPEAAKRVAIRELKQVAGPLLLFLFICLINQWILFPGKPAWRRAFNSARTISIFVSFGALIFAMTFSLAQRIVFSIWPDGIEWRNAFAPIFIPCDEVREIVVSPNHVTVVGVKRNQRIAVAAEIDGYAELLESLRMWAPEVLWRQAGGQLLRRWAILALSVPGYFLFTRFVLAHPPVVLVLIPGIFLISPLVLWRIREIPVTYRWIGAGGSALTALTLFGLLYIMR